MDICVVLILFFELVPALFLLWKEKLINSPRDFLLPCLILLLSMLVKSAFLSYESDDYLTFLAPWTEFFRERGFAGLGSEIGNYNPPYMYLLLIISQLPLNDLYLIKLFSILFDVLLAWSATKLLSLCTQNRIKLLVCFFSLLLLPTFVINSSMWAQCDSIYCFFGVYSIYLALTDKPWRSMVCIAASLAFKLQAVFIMPVFVVLLITKKLKPLHFLAFPLAYSVFMLPSVIAGRSFVDVMTLYFKNAGTAGSALNYNAPSLTSILNSGDPEQVSKLFVLAAFLFMLAVLVLALIKRTELDSTLIVGFTALLVIGIPYLLPHMHDRYFYLAGVLTVMLACYNPKYISMPLLAELSSLHCYAAYFSKHYIVHPRLGGYAMLAVLIMAIIFVLKYKSTEKHTVLE